jgi:hypothetical protein
VLFTDNRNAEGEKSLEATLQKRWQLGDIPVLTVSEKARLEDNSEYLSE